MTEKLRVGIIGCGEISGLTSWGYRIDERADIYAVADPNTERAEQCGAEWKAEKIYEESY